MIFLSRSSNSPRYFVPATSEPMSSVSTRLFSRCLGHVAGDDALGQALGDGGLADAGLADQGRVVLRLRDEDLDDALDLLLAADDRVELAGAGGLGEVDAELVDGGGLAGALGLRRSGRRQLDWDRTRMTSWRTLSRFTPRLSRTPAAMPSPSRTRPSSRCSVPM